MSIMVTMTETEVQTIATRVGKPLTRQEAAVVLDETERKLQKDHATGRARIFESAVLRVLYGQP